MDYKNIKSCDGHVIIEEVKNFKLKHIFECGQVFRFEEIIEGNFIIIAFGKVIGLKEEGNNVLIYNSTE